MRVYNRAGNASAWAVGRGFVANAAQENNGAVVYTGAWRPGALSGAYGGSVRHAETSGSKAIYSFTGAYVSWVSTRARNGGKAEVWLDGARVATVDLYADSTQTRQAVFTRAVPDGAHKLEIRVLGTRNASSSGTRVDVDAFVVLRQ